LSHQDYALTIWKVKAARWPGTLDNPAELGHKTHMVIESIREFNRASPFKPYEIQMASGERYEVQHPDFIFISPKASFVIVFDANEHPYHLSTLLIEGVSPRKSHRRRKKGNH
jgi:hypothetical protein